jgi:membrane associated rhomboid family serine protease
MLLPIGHDQTTVRRMPWVTLGIIAGCVVAFVLTLLAPGDEGAVREAERQAVEFAVAHPYLELDPQLKGYIYYTLRQQADEVEPPSADEQRAERAELDRLEAAYFAARDRLPYWRWGVVPADVEPAALVTYTFVHGGWLHLIGNLFFLYLVGPAVEDVWGRWLFAAFYVAAGVVAALTFIARYPDLAEPLIGASGAIAGVMGAFAVRYWSSRITFYYFVFFVRIYQGTFEAPAGLMLGLWALGELAFAMGLWGYLSVADLGDVGFLAHVGGFVFGVGAAWLVGALRIEERFVEPAQDRRETVHDASDVEEALDLARRGRHEVAMARLSAVLARDPGDADAAAALWNTAVAADMPSTVVPQVLPALEAAARVGDAGLPAQIWADLVRRVPEAEVDPRTALRLAELLMRDGLHGDVETTLLWFAGRVDARTPEGLLVRLARLAKELGVPAPFAALALEREDLSPELAAELRA